MTTTRTPHPRHHYLTGASSLLPVSHQHPSSLFFPFLLLLPPEPSLHAVVVHYRREAVPSIPGARAADRLAIGQRRRLHVALPSYSSGEHWTPQSSTFSSFPINLITVHAKPGLCATVFTIMGSCSPAIPSLELHCHPRSLAAPSGQPQRAVAGQQQAAASREWQQQAYNSPSSTIRSNPS